MCFPLLLFSIPLKNMFYNYLIFSMVALSLRIFKKYFVSPTETNRFTPRNKVFQALKHFVCLYEQVIRSIGM